MSAVNNIIGFFAIVVSIIVAAIFFSGLFRLREAFKEFQFSFSRLIRIYWYTRSNRRKLVRLYLELFIMRSGGQIASKEMFKEINDEFLILRDHTKMVIEIDDCSFITAPEFNECVKHYFDFFSKPFNRKKFLILQDEPLSFISTISISEGFLSPYVLIDGLIMRYQDSWPHIINKYKEFTTAREYANPQDLSFLFSWLLWGPSWQPVLENTHYAVLFFAFGDENNAIPVILPTQSNKFANQWREKSFSGECCDIQIKLYDTKSYLDAHWEQFTPEYQYTMQKHRDRADDYCYLMEYQSHNRKLHLVESKYYCTAYQWIMLERITNNYDPFSIKDCIVMFEHANMADEKHREFLMKMLITKTFSYLIEKYKENEISGKKYRYRFCIASNKNVEKAFQNRLREISTEEGNQFFNEFVIAESVRTPISILIEIDNVFTQGRKMDTPVIEEAQNDKEGITDLCNMYGRIFLQAFPNADERESLENIIQFLQSGNEDEERHIIHIKEKSSIIGSMIFSYFQNANAGYIPYIVIDSGYRQKGYARLLFERAMQLLEQDAKKHKKDIIKYVFLEIDKFDDYIPPYVYLWHSLGFKRIDLSYIQPPLNKEKSHSENLFLLVHPLNPKSTFISSEDVKLFLKEFFTNSFDIPMQVIDNYIKEMNSRLDEKEMCQLLSIIPS
jgi:ribosomal protein S18 acetylase RimI-like enzyme